MKPPTQEPDPTTPPLAKTLPMIVLIAAIITLVIAGDVIVPAVFEGMVVVLEFMEEAVETFFDAVLGFGHHTAQILTAWVGAIVLLAMAVVIVRKAPGWIGRVRLGIASWRAQTAASMQSWRTETVSSVKTWWASLNWIRKGAVVVVFVTVAIPLAWYLAVTLVTLLLAVI